MESLKSLKTLPHIKFFISTDKEKNNRLAVMTSDYLLRFLDARQVQKFFDLLEDIFCQGERNA